jgi:hypothetical protein
MCLGRSNFGAEDRYRCREDKALNQKGFCKPHAIDRCEFLAVSETSCPVTDKARLLEVRGSPERIGNRPLVPEKNKDWYNSAFPIGLSVTTR